MVGVLVNVFVGVSVGVLVKVDVGVSVAVGVDVADCTQVLSNTDTLAEPSFAVARSCLPSPLTSPTATDLGKVPTAKLVGVPKLPVPTPGRTDTLLEPMFATARSCLPSPLKSPTATEKGL